MFFLLFFTVREHERYAERSFVSNCYRLVSGFRLHDGSCFQVKEEITIEEHHLPELPEYKNLGKFKAGDHQTLDLKHKDTLSISLLFCEICSAPCRDLLQLSEHSFTHLQKHLACKVCHRTFNSKDNLARHRIEHQQHYCKICQKQFKCPSDLRNHLVAHSDERPYSCDSCNTMFKRAYDLERHRNKHTKETHFECKVCRRTFETKDNLARHRIEHHQHDCKICRKRFKCAFELSNHLVVHSDEPLTAICSSDP